MIRRFGIRVVVVSSMLLSALLASPARTEQKIQGDEPPHAGLALIPLMQDLTSDALDERIAAAMAIRELGETAKLAVPLLIEALADDSVAVRMSAAGALGGIGGSAQSAVPALTHALSDSHRFVRSWAAMALYEIGSPFEPADNALIHLMKSDSENLRGRSWAAMALPQIDADPNSAVPALVYALAHDPSDEVRAVAVLSLEHYLEHHNKISGRLGAAAALYWALRDTHWNVRGNAACAFPKLRESAATRDVSSLVVATRDPTPFVRGCAVRALGEIGSTDITIYDDVARLLHDEDAHVRFEAKRATARLDSHAR